MTTNTKREIGGEWQVEDAAIIEAGLCGYGDRMTGHERDAPLNTTRDAYLAGYRKAERELRQA